MKPARARFVLLVSAAVLAIASSASAATPTASPPPSLPGAPAPSSSLVAEGFVLIAEEKGVKVYRREQRPGLELAAEGKLDATPERVRRLLIDYPSHHSWQQRLKESRVITRGTDCLDVYQRLQLPVIDDRDFTLHVTWGSDAKVFWLRFATAKGQGPPPVDGVVRVTEQEGGWRLEPADGGLATLAIYRFHMDLAGSLPSGAGHGQAADALPELFASISKQLPSYR